MFGCKNFIYDFYYMYMENLYTWTDKYWIVEEKKSNNENYYREQKNLYSQIEDQTMSRSLVCSTPTF